MKKSIHLFAFLLALVIIIPQVQAVQSASLTLACSGTIENVKTMSIGVNYLSLYHMYSINDTILNRDFSKFEQDGISVISLALWWYRLEGNTRGSYNGTLPDGSYYGDRFLDNIKHVIEIANQHDIKVFINFDTLWGSGDSPWCTPDYVIDPVSGSNIGLAIVRNASMQQAFVDMFNHTVQYLAGTPGIWAWAILNEPWYWGRTATEHDFVTSNGQTQKENFISLIQTLSGIVKTYDGRPVTIKFVNSHDNVNANGTVTSIKDIFTDDWGWNQQIFNALDFISLNAYTTSSPDQALQAYWVNITTQNVLGCIQRNKQVWITEFGFSSNDDQVQASDYATSINLFKTLPVNGYIAWFWRGDSPLENPGRPGEGYNLCANATTNEGRLAYQELVNSP